MDKRETLHMLIDKLLDVAESGTTKELSFYYMTLSDCQLLSFSFREGNGSSVLVLPSTSVYFGNSLESSNGPESALNDIEKIKNTPDVEPKVSLTLSREKAKELGLIA